MKTQSLANKKRLLIKLIILFVFLGIMLFKHRGMDYLSDDYVNIFVTRTSNLSLKDLFSHYLKTNGRICTDVLANIIYKLPFRLWKILDSCLYVFMAVVLTYLFTDFSVVSLLIVCLSMLTYPMQYLTSAGYIATTTNYVYPIIGILISLLPIKRHGKVSMWMKCLVFLAIIYVSNHDQSAVSLIGILFLYCFYLFFIFKDIGEIQYNELKQLKYIAVSELLFSIAVFSIMFMLPGHIARASGDSTSPFQIPGYIDWTLSRKIYHGFSSTMANLIFERCKIYLVICVLVALVAFSSEKYWIKAVGSLPFIIWYLIQKTDSSNFICYYSYSWDMPDFQSFNDGGKIAVILSIISLVCIILIILFSIKGNKRRWFSFSTIVIAFGSRIMMGLSPTLYGSSFRTFTMLLYCLIVLSILLFQELIEENNMFSLGAGTASLILVSFI